MHKAYIVYRLATMPHVLGLHMGVGYIPLSGIFSCNKQLKKWVRPNIRSSVMLFQQISFTGLKRAEEGQVVSVGVAWGQDDLEWSGDVTVVTVRTCGNQSGLIR